MPHLMERGFSRIWGGNESTTRIATNRRHFVGRRNGKDLLRRNHRGILRCKPRTPKRFRKFETRRRIFVGSFSANDPSSASGTTAQNRKDPCQPLRELVGPVVGWMVSIHLREPKMRCWGHCGRLCGSTVLPLKFRSSNAEGDAGRLDRTPSLPAVLSFSHPRS